MPRASDCLVKVLRRKRVSPEGRTLTAAAAHRRETACYSAGLVRLGGYSCPRRLIWSYCYESWSSHCLRLRPAGAVL